LRSHSRSRSPRSRSCSPRSRSRSRRSSPKGSPNSDDFAYVEAALKKITGVLHAIMARVERVEEEVTKQQRLQNTPSSSSDVTPRRPGKVHVPLAVRVSASFRAGRVCLNLAPSHACYLTDRPQKISSLSPLPPSNFS
jgi:hypothetical protein